MAKLEAADIAFARVSDMRDAGAASASAADHGRDAERPGVLSGAGGACDRRDAPLRRRCRRSASIREKVRAEFELKR